MADADMSRTSLEERKMVSELAPNPSPEPESRNDECGIIAKYIIHSQYIKNKKMK